MRRLIKTLFIVSVMLTLTACMRQAESSITTVVESTLLPSTETEVSISEPISHGIEGIPDYYMLASDEDFEGERDGEFIYIGDADYVIIPKVIKGVTITTVHDNYFLENEHASEDDAKRI